MKRVLVNRAQGRMSQPTAPSGRAAIAPPAPRRARALAAIWILAFAIRCLYLWQIAHAPFYDLRLGDADAYDAWARRIAAGDWIGQGVFYQAPLYPYLLALLYRTLGDDVTIVRIVQALLGATSCALLAAAAASFVGEKRAVIAGALLAVYPPAIFLDGLLEKSSFVTFFTVLLLWLVSKPPTGMTTRRWLVAGAVLGLLTLARENALLLMLPLLSWIALAPTATRHRSIAAAALVAGCLAILVPVGIRNLVAGGGFHLTTAQFGPNFYIGNHAGASGTYEALTVGHGSAADEREDATRLAEQSAGRALTASEVSAFWSNRAWSDILSQPIAWIRLLARKAALTFNAAEIADTETLDVYAEWSTLLRALRPFDFGVLLGLAALGAVLTASSSRRLWLLYAVAATYTASVVLFYVFARYRFPIAPVLMVLAAAGVVQTARLAEGWQVRRLAPALAAAAGAVVLAHVPLENARASRAMHYADIGAAMAKDPNRASQAIEFYLRALGEAPENPAAQFGVGTLLARIGRPSDAIAHYESAVHAWPEYAEARYNLGLALAAVGRREESARQLAESVRLRPDDVEARLALAKVMIGLQRPDLALAQYDDTLALQADNVKALVGSGVALTQLGRSREAIERYQRALKLAPDDVEAHNNLGYTLASEGHLDEALPHFERALALNPGDENARRNLAQAREVLRRQR
jgi:Flp pilus assembly protein TadD